MRRDEVTPAMTRLMSPVDQASYGTPGPQPSQIAPPAEPGKLDKLEREEQREFVSWLMLYDYPFYWHSTAHRSKATPGFPDFAVGVCGETLYIEFKLPGKKLSKDQEAFKAQLAKQGIPLWIVYSMMEGRELVLRHDLSRLDPEPTVVAEVLGVEAAPADRVGGRR